MDFKDLNELRTIEECDAYVEELKSELSRLNKERAGQLLSEEERGLFVKIDETIDAVNSRSAEFRRREETLAKHAGDERRTERAVPEWRGAVSVPADPFDLSEIRANVLDPSSGAKALRDHALRAVEQEHFHGTDNRERVQGHVEGLIRNLDGATAEISRRVLLTGSPLYHRAFSKAIAAQGGAFVDLTNEERTALAAGAVGTGGAAVPYSLDPTVTLVSDGAINPYRQISRVVQITGTTWQGVTTTGITASYASQAAEASDNAPTLVQPEITPARAQAFVPFSFEIGQDWPALQAEMTRLFADAKDVLEATKFTTGTGSNEPEGIVYGLDTPDDSSSVVDTASIGAFAVADLYTVKNALPPRFRSRAVWLGNGAIYDLVRQFDDEGGADLWVQLEFDRPANLIGRPAYEASAMDSAVAANNQILVYGDFSHYVIVDRIGMSVELIPHLFGGSNNYPTGQRGLFAFWRNSAEITSENAFRLLEVKAS